MRRFISLALIAAGILGVIGSLWALALSSGTFTVPESDSQLESAVVTRMPNLRGLSLDDALSRLGEIGITEDLISVEESAVAGPKGTVHVQQPRPGEIAGTSIVLSISTAGPILPDVTGRDVATARSLLVEAGIPEFAVSSVEREYAGLAGLVLSQTPAAGTSDPDSVVLAISRTPTMPDVIGMTADEAIATLAAKGVEPNLTPVAQFGAAGETVIEQSIVGGQAIVGPVTLAVARLPDAMALTELDPVERTRCTEGTYVVAGVRTGRSVSCLPREGSDAIISYRLSGSYVGLTAKLAVADQSDPINASVVILVDGGTRGAFSLGTGAPPEVSVPLDGADTLSILVAGDSNRVVLVDAVVYGVDS